MERPTKEQINSLPLYPGLALSDILVVDNEQAALAAVEALKNEPCVGFDTESKPIFRKGQVSPGPTLIQLATPTQAFLFYTRFSFAVAAVRTLLENSGIQKVGFGLKEDNRELRGKLDIDIKNTFDLSVKLKQLAGDRNTIGARAGVAMVLHYCLGKGAQRSNWGAYPLKEKQLLYAANDAHCAVCIAQVLAQKTAL